ncbi:hypothetical protein J8273_5458 [Carpediemonas membranifera]|uniref:Uncharacterized protein n=1 Tax=Carpediemonas membranifera TaxID=201153 RepID=A0A8J6BWI0_9EUKA|nr:hypothetical protein J8273_5458 [Carpediemonas membranifera]|eukprot:KAG9392466.1 hypothetical protein J8273_5458 [Carpediemonas membranifera]
MRYVSGRSSANSNTCTMEKYLVPPELRKYMGNKRGPVRIPRIELTADTAVVYVLLTLFTTLVPMLFFIKRPSLDTVPLVVLIHTTLAALVTYSIDSVNLAQSKGRRGYVLLWGLCFGFIVVYAVCTATKMASVTPDFFALCVVVGATVTMPLAAHRGQTLLRLVRGGLRTYADISIVLPALTALSFTMGFTVLSLLDQHGLVNTWPTSPALACMVGKAVGCVAALAFIGFRVAAVMVRSRHARVRE